MHIQNITHEPHGLPWPQVYRAYHNGAVYYGASIAEVVALAREDAKKALATNAQHHA